MILNIPVHDPGQKKKTFDRKEIQSGPLNKMYCISF